MYKHIFSFTVVLMCVFFIVGSSSSTYNSKLKNSLIDETVSDLEFKVAVNKSVNNDIFVSYWLGGDKGAYTQKTFIINNLFLGKFTSPYYAVMIPNGASIDKNNIHLTFEYREAPEGMTVEQVKENINDYTWINTCARHEYTFTIDNSQDDRVLDVLNKIHIPKPDYHWEIIKPNIPENLKLPENNVFFDFMGTLEFTIHDVPDEIFHLEHFASFGKFTLGPVAQVVKFEDLLPDLSFEGALGMSEVDKIYTAPGEILKNGKWLCNCSNKDITVKLNAVVEKWNLNDFSFYNISNLDSEYGSDFVLGSKIGNNNSQITIEKFNGSSQEGVTYPKYSLFKNCNCKQIAVVCNTPVGLYSEPAILKFTAVDISNQDTFAESDILVFENSNKVYPILNVYNNGKNLILSWFDPNAVSYKLYYLIEGSTKVQTLDLKKLESAVLPSDEVPPLYMAIQACYADQTCSGISNIEKTH